MDEITKTYLDLAKFEVRHRYIILFILSILIAYFLVKQQFIYSFFNSIGNFGYIGAFVAGMFFTYSLTVPFSTVVLIALGNSLNPFIIAVLGGFGAVMSDYIIFLFVKEKLVDELKLVQKELKLTFLNRFSKSKVLGFILPAIAGFIIASPLPDEIGVAILGSIKYDKKKFLVFSYVLNTLGILAISSWSSFINLLTKIFYLTKSVIDLINTISSTSITIIILIIALYLLYRIRKFVKSLFMQTK